MERMMPVWGGSPGQWGIVEDIPFDEAFGHKQFKYNIKIT
jgi:hypothetical protein